MAIFNPASGVSPGQIDAARRILAHPAKRTYAKGSAGTTVRAIKIFLKWKGHDPGPINGRWDETMTRAAKKYGIDRATPSAIAKMSTDFGPPGPRPPRQRATVQLASMRHLPTGLPDAGDALRNALSQPPPGSGVGPQAGFPSTEDAAAMASRANRSVGDLTPPDEQPETAPEEPDAGAPGFGPGSGASDPYQQGFGNPAPLQPKNTDFIPPVPGGAEAGPPGDLGAGPVGGPMNFDPSALTPDAGPPVPAVMPSPAEGGMPFGPGNAAGDPYQQGFGNPDPMGGAPPPPPPGGPLPQGMPTPDQGPVQGGLTAADLVPLQDQGGGSPMPQALGNQPDMSGGDLGALPPAGMPPPPSPTPQSPPDYVNQGNLGDLPPAVRSPDQVARRSNMPPGAGMPGDLAGTIPPDGGGDLGALPPLPRQRPDNSDITGGTNGLGKERIIRKGDSLWKIAEEEYGDPRLWPAIAQANPGIKDPNLIYYGKKLVIPAL